MTTVPGWRCAWCRTRNAAVRAACWWCGRDLELIDPRLGTTRTKANATTQPEENLTR